MPNVGQNFTLCGASDYERVIVNRTAFPSRRSIQVIITTVLLACATTRAAAATAAEFDSPCIYKGKGGTYRWKAKIDPMRLHIVAADHKLIPSQLFDWTGGRGKITATTPRQGREKEWFQITGRVTLVRVENDGDLHVQLADVNRTTPIQVVVEIPSGKRWCGIRKMIFAWTATTFPIATAGKELNLVRKPIVRATGKAFWDGTHSSKPARATDARSNHRNYDTNISVWEIHPVMKLEEIGH
jgi:hypothetical protein